jgi:hypothetical protein
MADRVANQAAIGGVTGGNTNISGASNGVKISYIVPAGKTAMVRWISLANILVGTPTIALQVIISGITINLWTGTVPVTLSPNISLNAGETVQIRVTTLAAGSTFDACFSVEEFLAA